MVILKEAMIPKDQVGVRPSWMQREDTEKEANLGDFVNQIVQMMSKVK